MLSRQVPSGLGGMRGPGSTRGRYLPSSDTCTTRSMLWWSQGLFQARKHRDGRTRRARIYLFCTCITKPFSNNELFFRLLEGICYGGLACARLCRRGCHMRRRVSVMMPTGRRIQLLVSLRIATAEYSPRKAHFDATFQHPKCCGFSIHVRCAHTYLRTNSATLNFRLQPA